jgi:hypothetical protein
MALGLPAGGKVEVEFTPSSWTDVTADLDNSAIQIHIGRQTVFSQPGSSTMDGIRLNNQTGKYSPNCQVLADGVTPAPHYPFVTPHLRVRYSNTPAGIRFAGFIRGWAPVVDENGVADVNISAVDEFDRLSKGKMPPPLTAAIEAVATPTTATLGRFFPFTEGAGARQAVSSDGQSALVPQHMTDVGNYTPDVLGPGGTVASGGGAVGFGAPGVFGYAPNGTCAQFSPVWGGGTPLGPKEPGDTGWCLQGDASSLSGRGIAIEMWINTIVQAALYDTLGNSGICVLVSVGGGNPELPLFGVLGGTWQLGYDVGGHLYYEDNTTNHLITGVSVIDGLWHQVGIVRTPNNTTVRGGGSYHVSVYLDGNMVWDHNPSDQLLGTQHTVIRFGGGATSSALIHRDACLYRGKMAYAAVWDWDQLNTIAPTDLPPYFTVHQQAALGYPGQTTDYMINRFLDVANIAPAPIARNLDAGVETVAAYDWAPNSIVQGCQDMATSEGGGSACYIGTDGRVTFRNRHFRTTTVVMTLDAQADLEGATYLPAYDDMTLFNAVTVTRAGATGSTQTVRDYASIAAYTLVGDPITTYADGDGNARRRAQYELAGHSRPGYRLSSVTVDMMTAQTSGLYDALKLIELGSRIRVVGLPPAQGPATQIDLYVEGWTETIGPEQYTVAFDTSPADWPPYAVWSTDRWQPLGATLTSGITRTDTTMQVTTSAGPTWTTSSGAYPMGIQIGQEFMTLTGPPSGSTSPQTFTSVTRGQGGTPAAAQTSGSKFYLHPAATWAL